MERWKKADLKEPSRNQGDSFFHSDEQPELNLDNDFLVNQVKIVSSLNQISNFSSISQMLIYLESLSSMVHFPFNHEKELDLSHNCAKRQVKAWDRFFSAVICNLRLYTV